MGIHYNSKKNKTTLANEYVFQGENNSEKVDLIILSLNNKIHFKNNKIYQIFKCMITKY